MIFKIELRNSPVKEVIIGSRFNHYSKALQELGDHLFYKFLTDTFNDISKNTRTDQISFAKFGGSDLRISWDVKPDLTPDDVLSEIINGIFEVNRNKHYYLKKYGYMILMHIGEEYMTSTSGPIFVKARLLSNWYLIEDDQVDSESDLKEYSSVNAA